MRSACWVCPEARSWSTTCCWVTPDGICLLKNPSKMMLVAWPRIFGPTAVRVTLATASRTTTATSMRSGRSRRMSRLAEGPKFCDFSPGMAMPIGPRPHRAAGPAGTSASLGRLLLGGLHALFAHAATSALALGLDDLPVRLARGEQLVMRSQPDDEAVLEDDDVVGVDDGRHPLRDDDHRRLSRDGSQRLAQAGVGREVERRERVVEQVDLRLAHQRAGDGQPLTLAARHVGAALGDRRLELVGHPLDEVLRLGDRAAPPTAPRRSRPGCRSAGCSPPCR